MNDTSSSASLAESVKTLGALFDQGTRAGLSLLGSLGSSSAQILSGLLENTKTMGFSGRSCGCEIPPPCWEPQPAGEVTSHVCPGGTATIRIVVTNDSFAPRHIAFHATGDATGVVFSQSGLDLGPMERETVAVSLPIPATAKLGEERDVLVWIQGCQEHFLRWNVKVASGGVDACCHEVPVHDGPDLVHHWYDHFYCPRPCTHGR